QNAAWSVAIDRSGRASVAGQPEREHTPIVFVDTDFATEDESDPIFAVCLGADGHYAADAHSWSRLWMRDAATGGYLFDIEPRRRTERAFRCAFGDNGQVLFVG